MALEPCLRHHYAKRLLRRARYSSSHRTGFQPVRIWRNSNFGHDCRHLRYRSSSHYRIDHYKMGTKKGHTSFLANYDDLPHELQTGLLPGDKRESMGKSSCSSISIDSLTFNLIIVTVIALGGYCISKTVSHFMPGFELPVFSCAFVVGMFIKRYSTKQRPVIISARKP